MLKIKLSIFSFLTFLLFTGVSAQINTNSPYSRYGLGEMERQGIGFTHAMGGAGIGMRLDNQINYLNPASYTSQDSSSFLFDFGINGSNTLYKSDKGSFSINNGSFSHLAISFPVTRWMFVSAGLVPYSKVGYDIVEKGTSTSSTIGLVDSYFEGSGGLNRVYFGTGVKWKNLSFGVNGYYLTGSFSFDKSYKFFSSSNYFETRITDKFNVNDIYLGLGAQYTVAVGDKSTLVLGATYDTKASLNGSYTNYARNDYIYSGQTYARDTINFSESDHSGIVIPSRIGLGASFNFDRKIILGFDYTSQDWTKFEMLGNTTDVFKKSTSMNLGIQYTPDDRALRGYLNHTNFRLGGYYNDTYLTLKGQGIKDMGATVGLGLPFRHSKSMFHISYQVGKRGTLSNGLLKETYQNIFLSVTLYDIWFIKPKFD